MVTIQGRLTELRELTVADTVAVRSIIGDDTVTRWLSFDSRSEEQCRAMLRDINRRADASPRQEYYLGVTVDSELIGFARLGFTGIAAGKLGYAVARGYWRRGFATDAVTALVAYGFRELGLHRISAAVGPSNAASISLLENIGMIREGVIRHHVFTNGEWRDSVLYSILGPEWEDSARTTYRAVQSIAP
ncbi:MAG: GNAT family N-acetyltransferase [Pseudonocardia sp.]|nr:GNAT family N-acetyltransferase [Pseudonocardia sp.]